METINNVEVQQPKKKKSPKKVLLIIAVVFIAVLILAFIFGEKVPDVKEADAIAITADEIAEKFLNDKEGTDKEFHNKVYEITGIVEESNGQYSLTFNTESGEYEIYLDIDKDRSNKVPELEEGDTATVRGLYNRVLTDRIDFKNCLYVSSEKAIEPTTEAPVEAETEAKKELSDEEVDRGVIERILEESMAQGFDEDCFSVDYNDESDSYVISMWQEDFTALIAFSKDDPDVKESWDNMVESLTTSSNQMLESIRIFDADANLTLNILNDLNKDNTLLMIYNGVVMYDEMNN